MNDNVILQVRKDLCLGCGLCAENCPQQAISLTAGQAKIVQNRCNHCGLCFDVCPQGAIVKATPVSQRDLKDTVDGLKDRAEDIIARIEKLTDQTRARSD